LKLHIATNNWGNYPSEEFKSKDSNNLWAFSEPSNKMEEISSNIHGLNSIGLHIPFSYPSAHKYILISLLMS
jgi:hypothetical protein